MYRFIDRLNRKIMISAVVAGCGLFATISPASADPITASDVDQALETIFCSNSFEAGECQVAMLLQRPVQFEAPAAREPAPVIVAPEEEEDLESATDLFGQPKDGC